VDKERESPTGRPPPPYVSRRVRYQDDDDGKAPQPQRCLALQQVLAFALGITAVRHARSLFLLSLCRTFYSVWRVAVLISVIL
jgi:hypothetical protein